MKYLLPVIAVLTMSMLAAGCTDLKPLQAQIDNLKSEVARNSADTAALKASSDTNAAEVRTASQSAAAAQSAANQALAAAQASQSCCDASNEKMDRMFRRSVSK
jgi:hypothetical protein